ncbi:molybdopterin-guanine dinucleotide biosynthesis protein MobA [Mycolicibacterium duvalii]|nr:NTP transferase domain-containing protein [Mycolicibacterium duvalii]PEG39924.1 molybdopterin-guanine dinucleotide biosynthesis protein MobA [Mycolicibacterium duvalii]
MKNVGREGFSAAGVLLAAGAGTRYGMPKVQAEGGAWLRAGVAALSGGGCDDVVVVLGAVMVDVPAPARAVIAPDWAGGLSNSVRAGLAAAPGWAEFAVLTTVDTPDVDAAVVRRALQAARSSEAGLARAVYGGRPGHPVVLARRHWPALLDTLHGDTGAGAFLRSRADVVAVDCADLASGEDVDEP